MSYEETLQYLYDAVPMFQRVGAAGYKPGLDTTMTLDKHYGHPHHRFRSIHVAGTNGKGSCSHTIAAILQEEGYRVGLYTSPHLRDFRERIRVNGECIPEQYVVDFVEKERPFFEPLSPSFFELTTAMAFKYFADSGVDIAVVEVGLGGRLDCTNIISPILSVITNIALDHTQFLGNTPAVIASEKAGIIKPGVPVVVGEYLPETKPVFDAKASEQHSPIVYAQDDNEVLSFKMNTDGIVYDTRSYGELRGALGGTYQVKNTQTVLTAVKQLTPQGVIISPTGVHRGFAEVCRTTGLMGRWQIISIRPVVICDTGHNVNAWQQLAKQLNSLTCNKLRIVFGMVDDKDINSVMALLPRHAVYYWTKAETKRAIDETDVMRIGSEHGLHGTAFASVDEAFKAAKREANVDDVVFVGGSSYVVADLLVNLC